MKKLAILASILMLSACTPRASTITEDFKLPKTLQHCEVVKLSNGKITTLYVVVCPDGSAVSTTKAGKYPITVSVAHSD